MTELEILKIIEYGYNTNAPAELVIQVIKKHCEDLIQQKEKLCEEQTQAQKI